MSELIWSLPVLAAIALVLGACRGETLGRILKESGVSFLRLIAGMILVCLVLQGVLYIIPRIA